MIGNHLEPFKFWCQKVLPNVYDDSLSYYEYLCKLNEYLNEVIGQINTLTDNMEDYESDLTATWLETKNYIDNYFNNLDVQQEINNKLDQMAQSGALSTLLAPIVGTQIGGVVASQIGGTVANQIDAVVANQINGSVAQQIATPTATAVNTWLAANVDPVGSAVTIDKTLLIGNSASDAQVTGSVVRNNPLAFYDIYKVKKYYHSVSANVINIVNKGYIKYADYEVTEGSAITTNGLIGYTQIPFYTTTQAYNTDDAISLDKVLFINVSIAGTYNIILSTQDAESWGPSALKFRKNVTLTSGKHIIPLTDMVAQSSIPNNTILGSIMILCETITSTNAVFEYGLCVSNFITDYLTKNNTEIYARITNDKSDLMKIIDTSPLNFVHFKKVKKFYQAIEANFITLPYEVSYLKYADYSTTRGSVPNTNGLVGKTTTPLKTINTNLSTNDDFELGMNIFIKVGTTQNYKITLLNEGAESWGPAGRIAVKTVSLKQGMNILDGKGFVVSQNISSGTGIYGVAISFETSTSTNDVIEIGIMNTNYINIFENKKYNYDIMYWGDSLTAGSGGTTTYGKVCSELLGLSYKVNGVGGETANTVAARQGGNNLIIPHGTVNGTYTLNDMKDMYGRRVNPLRRGADSTVNPIKIDGQECTLTLTQSGDTDPNAYYTISGFSGELLFDTICEFNGNNLTSDITCIWVGTNDWSTQSIDERVSIIKSMISKINEKYVVLGISMGNESTMASDDARMLQEFGNHFFPTRKMLVENGLRIAGVTPTEQDTADIAIGMVPTSLRVDSVHLNNKGYTALGKMVASKLVGLGYANYAT